MKPQIYENIMGEGDDFTKIKENSYKLQKSYQMIKVILRMSYSISL